MAPSFDHLSREQALQLLDAALSFLPPARRRDLLALIPAPPTPPAPREEALARVIDVAEEFVSYLDGHPEEMAAWMNGDDWEQDPELDADLSAQHAALDEALADACAWLATQRPSQALAERLSEVTEAIDDLMAWECPYATGVTYGERTDPPRHLQAFSVWSFLAGATGMRPDAIAARLASEWPRPVATGLLAAALGSKAEAVSTALRGLADAGNDGAARWMLQEAADDAGLLGRYAHLARDLGERWSQRMAEAGAWRELAEGAERGVQVPDALLFRARIRLGLYEQGFRGALAPASSVDFVELWDEAVRADQLPLLRSLARVSQRRTARWVALEEHEFLRAPARYDHEETKKVVAYAIARATGTASSRVRPYDLGEALLSRLAVAPGPHDEAACVSAALDGLERMIAFHVAARSRNRYARAAAYWAEHRALATRFGLAHRHAALHTTFAEELRRLPALRDELGMNARR